MSAQPTETPPPDVSAAISDNRLAVQVVIDELALPAPTLVARPLLVHITLADVDDLAEWLLALGGHVTRSVQNPAAGASLWTLRTETPVRANGRAVAIHVHCPVVSGEDVLTEVLSAVTE
jgi:hypothetical protein